MSRGDKERWTLEDDATFLRKCIAMDIKNSRVFKNRRWDERMTVLTDELVKENPAWEHRNHLKNLTKFRNLQTLFKKFQTSAKDGSDMKKPVHYDMLAQLFGDDFDTSDNDADTHHHHSGLHASSSGPSHHSSQKRDMGEVPIVPYPSGLGEREPSPKRARHEGEVSLPVSMNGSQAMGTIGSMSGMGGIGGIGSMGGMGITMSQEKEQSKRRRDKEKEKEKERGRDAEWLDVERRRMEIEQRRLEVEERRLMVEERRLEIELARWEFEQQQQQKK